MSVFSAPAQKNNGFTLVELVVVMGIILLLLGSITEIFLSSYRAKNAIFDQLSVQGDGRRAVDQFIADVRRATYSAIGAYPIEYADAQQFIFFTTTSSTASRDRVRYFLSGTDLKRGVINPAGTPPTYLAANEKVTIIAQQVGNGTIPLFYYYDQNYTGATSTYLPLPIDVSKVRMVGIKLVLDKNPNTAPVPFIIESKAEIRNLKSN
jgi:prepilin-type N-terminal cleavage/methylation domain-containing protein